MSDYAIQHSTTKLFLTVRPSLNAGVHTSQHEQEAERFQSFSEGTIELLHLAEFARAYRIVPLEVQTPTEESK